MIEYKNEYYSFSTSSILCPSQSSILNRKKGKQSLRATCGYKGNNRDVNLLAASTQPFLFLLLSNVFFDFQYLRTFLNLKTPFVLPTNPI